MATIKSKSFSVAASIAPLLIGKSTSFKSVRISMLADQFKSEALETYGSTCFSINDPEVITDVCDVTNVVDFCLKLDLTYETDDTESNTETLNKSQQEGCWASICHMANFYHAGAIDCAVKLGLRSSFCSTAQWNELAKQVGGTAALRKLLDDAQDIIANPIREYVVWNADHISMTTDFSHVDTFNKLVAAETETGQSYSSIVKTNDIELFSSAIANEWNGNLLYQQI